jgi:hypothetical protein
VVEVNGDEDQSGNRRGNGPGKVPAQPPWFADGDRLGWRWRFQFRQGERNQVTALRAHGEVVEQLLAFMRGQRLFHKGADLVGVWMESELKWLAHG